MQRRDRPNGVARSIGQGRRERLGTNPLHTLRPGFSPRHGKHLFALIETVEGLIVDNKGQCVVACSATDIKSDFFCNPVEMLSDFPQDQRARLAAAVVGFREVFCRVGS